MRRRLLYLALGIMLPLMGWADTIDLSGDTTSRRIVGDDIYGLLGTFMAVGDINGDMQDDLIVGAGGATPAGRSSAGKVYVFYGPYANIADSVSSADVVIEGSLAGGQLGTRVATGDINGDGIDDILASAPLADPPGLTDAGIVYVIYGDPLLAGVIDLSVTTADVTLTGGSLHELGTALAAGDIDANGTDDLVIGAPKASGPFGAGVGRLHVIFSDSVGSGNELDPAYDLGAYVADLTVWGRQVNDNLGATAFVADMDGDGLADIITSAYLANPNSNLARDDAGEVYVIKGRTNYGLFQNNRTTIPLSAPSQLLYSLIQGAAKFDQAGYSIAVGDMTYDGVPELALSANSASPLSRTTAGAAYVVDGTQLNGTLDLALPATPLMTVMGAVASDAIGFATAIANVNGDGMGDLIIGAPFSDANGSYSGHAYLVYGDTKPTSVIDLANGEADRVIMGDDLYDATGYSFASGDLDADGVKDLLVASPGALGANASAGEVVLLISQPPNVDMSPVDTVGHYSTNVTIPLRVDSTTGLRMVEVNLDLLYNGDTLAYTSYDTTGTLIGGWDTLSVIDIPGAGQDLDTLRLYSRTTGPSARTAGDFFAVSFDVTDERQPNASALTIDHLLFNGGRPEWNDLVPGFLTVIGSDGELATTVVSTPGDTVRIRLTDIDANLDTTVIDILTGTATNLRTNEIETLLLAEQGVNDSVFFTTLFTLPDLAAGTDDDGTMQVGDDDIIQISVRDSLDSSGAGPVRVNDHLVIDPLGDADDNDALQAFDASRILAHAIGLITLAGRDSLAANVDALAPAGPINSYDAVLVIRRALGLIDRFPVQADTSANHPQPETDASVAKALPEMIAVSWQRDGAELVLLADERQHLLAGDLQIDGLPMAATVRPAADLAEAQIIYQHEDDRLVVGLAIPQPLQGPGELLRIRPKPGTVLPRLSQVHLTGQFNGGALSLRVQGAQTGVVARPRQLMLHENFPNPFNAETTIRFDLPEADLVKLSIYNTAGQRIRMLVNGVQPAGNHQIVWDSRTDEGRLVASGTYVYVLESNGLRLARPLLLLK